MISDLEIIVRLALASVLGLVVGYERELHNQPAGLRTHMILVIGSALAMTLSINIAMQFRPYVPNGDPARLAAQVISGIGFLGAGAILRFGTNIKGLTTATSLWTMAIVGLTVGAGHYISSIAATVLILIALSVLDALEKRFIRGFKTIHIYLEVRDRPGLIEEIQQALRGPRRVVHRTGVEKVLEKQETMVDLTLRIPEEVSEEDVMATITALEGVHRIKIT